MTDVFLFIKSGHFTYK